MIWLGIGCFCLGVMLGCILTLQIMGGLMGIK